MLLVLNPFKCVDFCMYVHIYIYIYVHTYTVCFNNLKTLHFAHKVVYFRPFKSHISVMVRKLFNLHALWDSIFSDKSYIHIMGQCYTVHPLKVKSNTMP